MPLLCRVLQLATQALLSWEVSHRDHGGVRGVRGVAGEEEDEEDEDEDEGGEGEEEDEDEEEPVGNDAGGGGGRGRQQRSSPFVNADDLSVVHLSDLLDDDEADGSGSNRRHHSKAAHPPSALLVIRSSLTCKPPRVQVRRARAKKMRPRRSILSTLSSCRRASSSTSAA